MRRSQHLAVDKIVFGEEYDDVHQWLDALFPQYRGFEHWKERHHQAAIEAKYKHDAPRVTVALLHVICDWASHLGTVALPKDAAEVLSILRANRLIDDR
jgi:hypothetical protein